MLVSFAYFAPLREMILKSISQAHKEYLQKQGVTLKSGFDLAFFAAFAPWREKIKRKYSEEMG
jgi:hypothetical protein